VRDCAGFDIAAAQQRPIVLLFVFRGKVQPLPWIEGRPFALRVADFLLQAARRSVTLVTLRIAFFPSECALAMISSRCFCCSGVGTSRNGFIVIIEEAKIE